uniref:HNH endonuclease n=1 Tax=candidate division CPR3 bacterium TaxID=2268181 RepID=A0A7V3N4P4_UNCC3
MFRKIQKTCKKCLECSKEFFVAVWNIEKKYCSRKCMYKSRIYRENLSKAKRGKKRFFTDEWRKNLSRSLKGRKFSKEHNEKIKKALLGKPLSKERREKISQTRKERKVAVLERNPNWKGGKSFLLYPLEWTEELKTSIRQRDKFVCWVCGKNGYNVHHIDSDKKNNSKSNLVVLCSHCHGIVHHWSPEFWELYLSFLHPNSKILY